MKVFDPVCGMRLETEYASKQSEFRGRTCYFCSAACQMAFEIHPGDYAVFELPNSENKNYEQLPMFNLSEKEVRKMTNCPVCGMMVDERSAPTTRHKGKRYYFHTEQHKEMFEKDPEKFLGQPNTMSSH